MILTLLYVYLSKKPSDKGLNTAMISDFFVMALIDFIFNYYNKGAT